MLKRLDAATGELKRLFVTQAARGMGTGRRLIEVRADAARPMGLERLVADTLARTVEMRALCPGLGVTKVPGPIRTTTCLEQPILRPPKHDFVREMRAG